MDQRPPLSQSRPLTQACQRAQTRSRNNRSGAVSGRSEPWRRTPNPQRKARKFNPPQSLLSDRRPDAAEPRPQKPQRSGVGPERALEANTKPPSAKRESSSSPEPTQRPEARCRVAPPTQNPSGAASGRSEPWRRTPNPQRKARKLLLPRAYSATGGPMPRSPFKDTVIV